MKKAEAISILATSVRPREAKDRARYDEAVKMAIEALKRSETPKSSERTAESAQNASSCAHENDLIFRQAAIEALARMMPRSYTPDGSHPADEEIFRAQEVFADCIEALEILPPAQSEIIRCKDCKYMIDTGDDLMCDNAKGWVVATASDFGCVLAERRTE